MSAWLLPDDFADALPPAARRMEGLRRLLLDGAQRFGYELVTPPLLEHLDSLLSGAGAQLDLQTFKLVDQLSGRTLGLRADTTPQVARIDAHLLNRQGMTRLCYAGPVVHTQTRRPYATREPLQFGAEIYGCADLQADMEVMELCLRGLLECGLHKPYLDLGDVRLVDALLESEPLSPSRLQSIHQALSAKDAAGIESLCGPLSSGVAAALQWLVQAYGGMDVLDTAQKILPPHKTITLALEQLREVAVTMQTILPEVAVGFDLSDLQGYAYYTSMRFAVYAPGLSDSLARGGRYDAVGAAFGRMRPAAGFSLDIRELAEALPDQEAALAICAPWSRDPALHAAVQALRARGETVVCLPSPSDGKELDLLCNRQLAFVAGHWIVRPMDTENRISE